MNKLILILFSIFLFGQTYKQENASSIELNSNISSSITSIFIISPNLSNNLTFTLPSSDGTNGQILATDGSGNTSWITGSSSSPFGVDGSVQFNNTGAFGGSSTFIFDDINIRLGVGVSSPSYTLHVNSILRTGNNNFDGGIILNSNGSNESIAILPNPNMTESTSYTFPQDYGNSLEGIVTNSSGSLSWGGGIRQGPSSNNSPDNNDIDGNADNGYIGGGEDNSIANQSDNVGVYGGENSDVSGKTTSSGMIAGDDNTMNNNQVSTAILGGDDNNLTGSEISTAISNGTANNISNGAEYSFIGAGESNNIDGNNNCVIFAGQTNAMSNDTDFSVIGAGDGNDMQGDDNGVWSGENNDTPSNAADRVVIFGGRNSTVSGYNSFIGGGDILSISDYNSVIFVGDDISFSNNSNHSVNLNGAQNYITASATNCIMGGWENTISNNNTDYTVLYGRDITANNDFGNVIFTDDNDNEPISSGTDDEFRTRFNGGYRLWTNTDQDEGATINGNGTAWSFSSDSNKKELKINLDPIKFYNKIQELPIYSWSYIGYARMGIRNYGPMAQDFYRLFGKDQYGYFGSDTTIKELDLVSIFALGVKGGIIKNDETEQKIEELEESSKMINSKLSELEKRLQKIKEKLSLKSQ